MKNNTMKLIFSTIWVLYVVALLSATGAANPRLNDNDQQGNESDRALDPVATAPPVRH